MFMALSAGDGTGRGEGNGRGGRALPCTLAMLLPQAEWGKRLAALARRGRTPPAQYICCLRRSSASPTESAMPFDPLAPQPLLTADLPGVGGRIKMQPEDFEVEEVPAYEPSGAGPHLYLWLEKRDIGADFFRRQI